MISQEEHNFRRISKAIKFLTQEFKSQPSLEETAEQANLSPTHFQKLFADWVGVSPKKFLQYANLNFAKKLLSNQPQLSIFDVAIESGLSSSSRLHDLFVNIEAMSPAEYKNKGEGLVIKYSIQESIFGPLLTASTAKGISNVVFYNENLDEALSEIARYYPKATFIAETTSFHLDVATFFEPKTEGLKSIKLHLKGTDFQLKVWEALLKIPFGGLSSYGKIATDIMSPAASRAVGTAIGTNPVAYIIPCHRVIQQSGMLGGYMWGLERKSSLLTWEAALSN